MAAGGARAQQGDRVRRIGVLSGGRLALVSSVALMALFDVMLR
jgi:hypothetical protein